MNGNRQSRIRVSQVALVVTGALLGLTELVHAQFSVPGGSAFGQHRHHPGFGHFAGGHGPSSHSSRQMNPVRSNTPTAPPWGIAQPIQSGHRSPFGAHTTPLQSPGWRGTSGPLVSPPWHGNQAHSGISVGQRNSNGLSAGGYFQPGSNHFSVGGSTQDRQGNRAIGNVRFGQGQVEGSFGQRSADGTSRGGNFQAGNGRVAIGGYTRDHRGFGTSGDVRIGNGGMTIGGQRSEPGPYGTQQFTHGDLTVNGGRSRIEGGRDWRLGNFKVAGTSSGLDGRGFSDSARFNAGIGSALGNRDIRFKGLDSQFREKRSASAGPVAIDHSTSISRSGAGMTMGAKVGGTTIRAGASVDSRGVRISTPIGSGSIPAPKIDVPRISAPKIDVPKIKVPSFKSPF